MYIIIPAYEPDHRLPQLVSNLRNKLPNAHLLVINDGSSASYSSFYQESQQLGATVLTHEVNRGKGAALKTAFSYLLDKAGADEKIVTIDSDGQHLISDMFKVLGRVEAGRKDLVLGSRAFVGKVPFRSRFGNKVTASLFGLVTGQAVSDTQTGLRAFTSSILPWLLSLDGDRFEYEFNMLLEAKRAGVTILEEPIETIYLEDNKSSHFRPLQDSARIYAPFIKFIASASAAALVDVAILFLMMALTKNLLLSVVLARLLSAAVQYSLNAKLVFKQPGRKFRFILRYGGLVLTLLACNYFLLNAMVHLGLGLVLAKLLTETILFVASYRLQQDFVFA